VIAKPPPETPSLPDVLVSASLSRIELVLDAQRSDATLLAHQPTQSDAFDAVAIAPNLSGSRVIPTACIGTE
jgi:hypothetical protein